MKKKRGSGILLHITSLPSPYGIGDLGAGARHFADFLAEAGQSYWQVLPINPSSAICGNSPYCGYSAYAGNPLLIAPDLLVDEGFLDDSDAAPAPPFPKERVDFASVAPWKQGLLKRAWERFRETSSGDADFLAFREENACWLDDYVLFVCLKEQFGGVAWSEWPAELRDRQGDALARWREKLHDRILEEGFYQYLFFRQWKALKTHCNERGVRIFGDVPIYVSYDSSDVWAQPDIFQLDEEKRPAYVAGVPPDYFSETGQRWGNPVYDWARLKETGYGWWLRRMAHNLRLFDLVRLDHFRGFVGFWEIPAEEETAVNGEWRLTPARDFFDALSRRFPFLPVVAEDLGIITPDVKEIMTFYGFPGMKVLQFAFGEDLPVNPYAPHNHTADCVVYPGTHDNNTSRGWFAVDADEEARDRFFRYIGRETDEGAIHWEFIRMAMMSVGFLSVVAMQDVLGLGSEARMNLPSIAMGNWEWRLPEGKTTPALAARLLDMARIYGRAPKEEETPDPLREE